ncbi:MAG: hypothetical protein NVSMB29_05530 [Candidatus Dormibacteria bacterium]
MTHPVAAPPSLTAPAVPPPAVRPAPAALGAVAAVPAGPDPLTIQGALLDKLLTSLREPGEIASALARSAQPLSVQRPNLRHFPQEGQFPREMEPRATGPGLAAAGHHVAESHAPTQLTSPLSNPAGLASLAGLVSLTAAVLLLAVRREGAIRGTVRRLIAGPRLAATSAHRLLRPALVAAIGIAIIPALAADADVRALPSSASSQFVAGTSAWAGPLAGIIPAEAQARQPAPAGADAPPAWAQLVQIENQVTADQVQLVAQERALKSITVLAARTAPGAEEVRPAVIAIRPILTNRLAEAAAVNQATQQHLEQTVQAEYDLFRSVAPAPDVRARLVAAAAEHASPEVQAAITFDLSAVQTQLAQEAAISAAEAQLPQVSAAGISPLAALTRHQPLLAPEVGVVTQPFGPTDFGMEGPLTYRGVTSPHFHWGLDIGCAIDTPVHAAADGVVVLASASLDAHGQFVGYGNHVVIAHPDGLITLYGHLNSLKVKAGDIVRQGQLIGLEGSTGWSSGPHLHFEVRHNNELLDPRPLLGDQLPG